jgi:PhzF family phenazine biosynthesis protein
MNILIYHVDAFTEQLFGGNPAAVCLLEQWIPDNKLQSIATENHLPATAFLVKQDGEFTTRWFTPEYEIDLCGHGTLASGYIILNKLEPALQEVELHSPVGLLRVKRTGEMVTIDFPTKRIDPCQSLPLLIQGLGTVPQKLYQHTTERCLAIFNTEEEIKQIQPDMQLLRGLGYRGIIISAPGSTSDFVSRVFYPRKLLSEDAVTGSSHCLLVPYWSQRLNKTQLHSKQLSHRQGELLCHLENDRVLMSGKAVIYMQGSINI